MRDNVFPSRRHHIAAARGGRCLLLGLAFALALPLPSGAQTTRETERKLQKLRTELKGVAQERRQIEGQRGQASRQLREADEKVARTGRAPAQTEAALREQGRALAEAEQRRSTLQGNLAQQHRELAGLLRAAYQLGNHAPLKLLLSQDTVADANRALAYHRYLQRERAQRITTLTADLKELEALQAQIAERKQKLQGTQQDQKQQAAALEADRRDRAKTVASLEERFKRPAREGTGAGPGRQGAGNIAGQPASGRCPCRGRAPRGCTPCGSGEAPPNVLHAKPPHRAGRHRHRPRCRLRSHRHRRRRWAGWLLSGNLLARYGGKLPDGRTSSGVLIGAPAGSTVTAVADGTVVFSDWMTGYGMILIVDHGNGYMSLYAHNDTLLKDAGARVSRGDAVAKVGNSGGQGVTALYFELRRGGQPVNPDSWLQRR